MAGVALPAQVAPSPATPTGSFPTSLKDLSTKLKIGLAGAGLTVLVVAYFVAGPQVASAEAKNQAATLQQTGRDLTKIDAFLTDVSVRDASKTDAVTFKTAVDAYVVKLSATSATLTADQDRMDAATHNIEFYGWLTPFQSKQVHTNDSTIKQANLALADVLRVVNIERTSTSFYSAYISAAIHSHKAFAAAKQKDWVTATTEFQQGRNDLSEAEVMVKDADVPPQFSPLVAYYVKVMRDLGGLTSAIDAHDGVGAVQYLYALDADDTALTFDQAGFRAWYTKKVGTVYVDFRSHAGRVPRFAVKTTTLV